jgi:hypothetical protein
MQQKLKFIPDFVYRIRVPNATRHTVETVETTAHTSIIVAYSAVRAVDLTQIALLPCVNAVLGSHIPTHSLVDRSHRIVSRRTMI